MTWADEQRRMTQLLKGRTVKRVWRNRKKELGIEFTDGVRLFVDWRQDMSVEASITGTE